MFLLLLDVNRDVSLSASVPVVAVEVEVVEEVAGRVSSAAKQRTSARSVTDNCFNKISTHERQISLTTAKDCDVYLYYIILLTLGF